MLHNIFPGNKTLWNQRPSHRAINRPLPNHRPPARFDLTSGFEGLKTLFLLKETGGYHHTSVSLLSLVKVHSDLRIKGFEHVCLGVTWPGFLNQPWKSTLRNDFQDWHKHSGREQIKQDWSYDETAAAVRLSLFCKSNAVGWIIIYWRPVTELLSF